jgi:molybdopterin-containing oxidoreductase family membrane subunit
MIKEASIRRPLILGHKTYHDITNDVVGPIEGKAPRQWKIAISIAAVIALYGVGSIMYLVGTGMLTEQQKDELLRPASREEAYIE